MNFNMIKTRCWRAIDDNPANPQLIDEEMMGELINDFLRKIGEFLYIEKMAEIEFTDGIGDLPADFIAANAVYHGTTLLEQITRIQDKVDDDAPTSQYYIPNNTNICIFGKTPTETVTLYYCAYPEELVDPDDVPNELPQKFHSVFEMYVKAWYALQTGDLANYTALTAIIEQKFIPEIEHYCSRDKRQVVIKSGWSVDDDAE